MTGEVYLSEEEMQVLKELTSLSLEEVEAIRELARLKITKENKKQHENDICDAVIGKLKRLAEDKYIDARIVDKLIGYFSSECKGTVHLHSMNCDRYTIEKLKEVNYLRVECVVDTVFIQGYAISINYDM